MNCKMRHIPGSLIILAAAAAALGIGLDRAEANGAELVNHPVKVLREGAEKNRVLARFWSGDRPLPIVDVNAKERGSCTEIQALATFENLEAPTIGCTIKNGAYNPLSKSDGSAVSYVTLTPVSSYRVLKAVKLTYMVEAPKDAVIENVVVGAGNICTGTLRSEGRVAKNIDLPCDVLSSLELEDLNPLREDGADEQWIYLTCQEGHKAFVRDRDLLRQLKPFVSGQRAWDSRNCGTP